jgi:hypothetical protein
MAYTVYAGSTVRFYTSQPFKAIDGTTVDPDVVVFSYSVQGRATTTFTYTWGTGDPSGTIVRQATGSYYADIDTTNLDGFWTWRWFGHPSSVGHDTTKTQVATEGSLTVSVANL